MRLLPLALALAVLPAQDEIPRARAGLAEAEAAVLQAHELEERVRAEAQELAQALAAARAEPPPRPAEIGPSDSPEVELLAERGQAWSAYLRWLEGRRLVASADRQRIGALNALLSELESAVGLAAARIRSARERVAQAALARADAAQFEGWNAANAESELSRLEESLDSGRGLSAELREGLETILEEGATAEPPDPEEVRTARVQTDALEVLQATAGVLRVRVAELVQGGDLSAVRQLERDASDEWALRWSELERLRLELVGEQSELEELEARMAQEGGPEEPDVPEGPEHEELRVARRDLAYAEAVLAWRQERLELVQEQHDLLVRLDEGLAKGAPALRAATAPLLERLAAARALAEATAGDEGQAPAEPEDEAETWEEARRLAVLEADRRWLREAVREKLAVDRVGQAEADVEARRERVEKARARVAREEEYAALFTELRAVPTAELLSELAPDGTGEASLAEARAEIDRLRKAQEKARRDAEPLLDELDSLLAPRARAEVARHPDRFTQIREELDQLARDPDRILPADASQDPARQRELEAQLAARRPGAAPSNGDSSLSPTPEELSELEAEHRNAAEQARFFEAYEAALAKLREAAQRLSDGEDALVEASEHLIDLERRRVAVAREAARRPDAGGIDLGPAQQPDRVDAAVQERTALLLGQERARDQRRRFLERCQVILAMKTWAGVRGEIAEERVDLIDVPVAHVRAARQTLADLADYERGNLAFQAAALESQETPGSMRFLARFADPRRRQRAEETLDAYYLERVDLERVRGEYSAALDAYQRLVEVSRRMQSELAGALDDARANEKAQLEEYQVRRYLAGIAADPDRRVRIQAAFREAYGYELFMPPDDYAWDRARWADLLATAEARLWGARGTVLDLEWARSRQGVEAELGRFQRHLTSVQAELDDCQTRSERVRRQIAELREDYSKELRHAGLATLGRVALIPLVAFVVIQLLRRGARTLRRRIVSEDVVDRRRRLETLASVSTATIRVVVWAIAGIYMLKALGLDVTPIIASASVAGLAVAFGAQSLVKDLFAGFFILLENQYGVGDIVDVGTASGKVEHISLRVTILRDLQGSVHYVPNGLIQRVSNKTKGWSRVVLEVSVPYGEDVDRVTRILEEVLAEVHADAELGRHVLEPPEVAGVQSFGDSTMNLRVMIKVQPGEQWGLARAVRARIKRALDRAGIEAPVPRRVVQGGTAGGAAD